MKYLARSRKWIAAAAAVGVGLTLAACSSAGPEEGDEAFYAGKRITIIVPSAAGGGNDLTARFLAQHLGQFIPGNPQIVVENRDQGSQVVGANQFANDVPKDGTWLLLAGGGVVLPEVYQQDGVEYDFDNFEAITGIGLTGVRYASAESGISSVEDLTEATDQLAFAIQDPRGTNLATVLEMDMLGADTVKFVTGYSGSGDARLAFLSGESDLGEDPWSGYLNAIKPLVDEGKATALYQFGIFDGSGNLQRGPGEFVEDMPTFFEVYNDLYGKDPSGPEAEAWAAIVKAGYGLNKVLFVHSEAPAEAVEALRDAMAQLVADEDIMADAVAQGIVGNGGTPFLLGDELAGTVSGLSMPDSIREWIDAYLQKNFDLTLN